MKPELKIFSEYRCSLGEGPLWHDERQELFWFDIDNHEMFSQKLDDVSSFKKWKADQPVSAAGIIDKDHLLIAKADGLFRFSIESGEWKSVAPLESEVAHNRSNDGRVAPDGSLWIGTMNFSPQDNPTGKIYRYCQSVLSPLVENISIPNSICFDVFEDSVPCVRCVRCYWTDTPDRRIYYIEMPLQQLAELRSLPKNEIKVFVDIASRGSPDGSVVDSQHRLWNAEWGSGKVVGYDRQGKKVDEISLPVTQPTCPAFVGKNFDQMAITSAYTQLTPEEKKRQPLSGMTFVYPLDAPGRREFRVAV